MIIKAFWTVEISTKSTMKLGNKSKYFKLTYDLFSKWGINIIWAKHVENIFLGLKNRQYFPVCYNSSDIAISFHLFFHDQTQCTYCVWSWKKRWLCQRNYSTQGYIACFWDQERYSPHVYSDNVNSSFAE